MMSSAPNPAAEIADLRAALAEERAALAEERAARTRAETEIEHLKLLIAKLCRERYGQSSERSRHLLDQLELQLEKMETAAGENASQGEADDGDTTVRAFTRRKPKRAPLPADLPRERVVLPSPEACPCCGGADLVKLGEDVTETLEAGAQAVEGGADGAGEVQLPGLRGHHSSRRRRTMPSRAGAPARPCWR